MADLRPLLRELRPWLVVDAAGPFQGSDYRVPEACIDEGCHYVDLADARSFVCGISALAGQAQDAKVTIVSGASSLPALTSAAADRLAKDLDRVSLIDIALSASNRASGSESVTAAILSYVGKPIPLWRGGRWQTGFGWQEMRRLRFEVPGAPPIRRHVALCDVPDLSLLPDRYPGRPAVRFRAGSELSVQNVGIWLLSWPVRWGWIRSLASLAPLGVRTQRMLRFVGGDRSAMNVLVKGWRGGRAVERRWTVFANEGHGPWIPSLAVPLLVDRLGTGSLRSGASSAAGLLDLTDFEEAFRTFAINTDETRAEARPLYARIMGKSFEHLPKVVREMHAVNGDLGATGTGSVTRGNMLARLAGRFVGLSGVSGQVQVSVWMKEECGVETWSRDFGGSTFSSQLYERNGLLIERFGLLRHAIELRPEPDGLSMHLRRWWIGPLPLPLWLGPKIDARERETEGAFHFDVSIRLPILGKLIHYRGRLTPTAEA